MEEVERERLHIGRQLGIELTSALELFRRLYRVEGNTLYEGIQGNPAYQTGKTPTTLNYRYIYEDIPYGLHPMVKLGEKQGVKMTCSNLLIDMASYLMKENLRNEVLGLSVLGLADMSPVEMVDYLKGEGNK